MTARTAQRAAATLTVTNLTDVRGNLTLPAEHDGCSVSWTSSEPGIVAPDGTVTRPERSTHVVLTATVSDGHDSAERTLVARVRAARVGGEFTGYLFAYFTGNSLEGENVYFALSDGNDALHWTELNEGEPVLTSKFGTGGVRDPFLIRSPEGDTFTLIATDLSIGSGTTWEESQRTGSRHIEVWQSHDLVSWSEQRHVRVSADAAGNTWAPEAVYDERIGAYFVFWASKLYAPADTDRSGPTHNVMLYATTRDFMTFSTPRIWQDPGSSVIDSTVLREGNEYHRFTKDEGSITGCADILHEASDVLAPAPSPSWTTVATCIGRHAGLGLVEGPIAFKANPGDLNGDRYYLFVDEYTGRGYVPLTATTLEHGEWHVPASYRMPTGARHGTVIPVTDGEREALRALRAP